jgi:hypothetical protein
MKVFTLQRSTFSVGADVSSDLDIGMEPGNCDAQPRTFSVGAISHESGLDSRGCLELEVSMRRFHLLI